MESKSNSFNCIIEGQRCTKCCEVIHLPIKNSVSAWKGKLHEDDVMIGRYWRRISKRIAKKRNPEMFSTVWTAYSREWLKKEVGFFKCLALKNGVCTIYDDRPPACKDFTGRGFYSKFCWDESQLVGEEAG